MDDITSHHRTRKKKNMKKECAQYLDGDRTQR